jgi:hypothetical protein
VYGPPQPVGAVPAAYESRFRQAEAHESPFPSSFLRQPYERSCTPGGTGFRGSSDSSRSGASSGPAAFRTMSRARFPRIQGANGMSDKGEPPLAAGQSAGR